MSPWFFIKDPKFRKEMENATFMTIGNIAFVLIGLHIFGVI